MSLGEAEERALLRRTVRGFVATHLAPLEAAVDAADAVDPATMRRLRQEARQFGLYGYNLPTEFGGGGLNLAQQVAGARRWAAPACRLRAPRAACSARGAYAARISDVGRWRRCSPPRPPSPVR